MWESNGRLVDDPLCEQLRENDPSLPQCLTLVCKVDEEIRKACNALSNNTTVEKLSLLISPSEDFEGCLWVWAYVKQMMSSNKTIRELTLWGDLDSTQCEFRDLFQEEDNTNNTGKTATSRHACTTEPLTSESLRFLRLLGVTNYSMAQQLSIMLSSSSLRTPNLVKLEMTTLAEGALTEICRGLHRNSTLHELRFCAEDSIEEVNELEGLLLQNTGIRRLTIWGIDCSPIVLPLARGLAKNKTLLLLDLTDASLGATAMQHLQHGLKENTALEELYLNDNFIDEAAVAALRPALRVNKHLRKLSIAENDHLGDAGAVHFFTLLSENNALDSINLADCDIWECGAQSIAKIFSKLRGLQQGCCRFFKEIELSENEFGIVGTNAILNAITANPFLSIDYLGISCQGDDTDDDSDEEHTDVPGANELSGLVRMLNESSSIRRIKICTPSVCTNEDLNELCLAMESNRTMVDIVLENEQFKRINLPGVNGTKIQFYQWRNRLRLHELVKSKVSVSLIPLCIERLKAPVVDGSVWPSSLQDEATIAEMFGVSAVYLLLLQQPELIQRHTFLNSSTEQLCE